MKKSIKYAGIAAATLLAVAPVAAPVVSSTTVQAADTVATDQSEQDNAVKEFGAQFADKAATKFSAEDIVLGSQKLSDFAGTDDAKTNTDLITTPASDTKMNDLIGSDATVNVSAKYGNTAITNKADLYKILADSTYPEVNFTITLSYYKLGATTASTETYNVTATRDDAVNELTSVNAQFTTPITVPLDSTTTSTQLQATTGTKLTDQNGDGVVAPTEITLGASYYNSYSDAIDSVNGKTPKPAYTTGNGVTFDKAGTYYQTVKFSANSSSSLGAFLAKYAGNTTDYTVYVNGNKASEGYDFVTDAVAANGDTAATNGTYITFVRKIVVSPSAENWTVTANKGVVTTKSDNAYYTLKNDDNETITNRALAKNTAWVTDQKRVDQDGNTQYRVATGEWIDANDVTFSDKATTDEGEYTDVQALNGKVTLDGPSSFIYMLYNDNGETVSNRALAGDSAWYTDKKATNAAGVTVYHVATGEWVQAGSGVNYVAY